MNANQSQAAMQTEKIKIYIYRQKKAWRKQAYEIGKSNIGKATVGFAAGDSKKGRHTHFTKNV